MRSPTTVVSGPRRRAAVSAARRDPLPELALGIDVGGTGVKAALVDLETAELATSRIREKTPQPSTPDAVIEVIVTVVQQVLAEARAKGASDPTLADLPVGCGVPGPIKDGVMKTAANLDAGWIDFPAAARISGALERAVHVINDADAAGMAELAYGEAKGKPGTIILLTVGTGIGSAVISEGRLLPNTELGHIELRRKGAETLVSGASRVRRGLGWKRWAREFNTYLAQLELYFWPDLIILGGGVSKESSKYERYLVSRAPMVKARFLNSSGIIGAAYAAALARQESGSVDGVPGASKAITIDGAADAPRSAAGRPKAAERPEAAERARMPEDTSSSQDQKRSDRRREPQAASDR